MHVARIYIIPVRLCMNWAINFLLMFTYHEIIITCDDPEFLDSLGCIGARNWTISWKVYEVDTGSSNSIFSILFCSASLKIHFNWITCNTREWKHFKTNSWLLPYNCCPNFRQECSIIFQYHLTLLRSLLNSPISSENRSRDK